MSASGNDPSIVGVLVSGGLDSSILAGQLLADGHVVQPFYVRCGLYWESTEQQAAEEFLEAICSSKLRPLVTFDMPVRDVYGDHWSVTGQQVPDADSADEAVFLPGRNALLLTKPAVWCQMRGIHRLALAPLAGNPFGDATDEFFDSFERMLGHLGSDSVQILRPFRTLSKKQVLQLGQHFPLALTFSCIAPQGRAHCGNCNKCTERRLAFAAAGLPDATVYVQR